jgi:chromosome segregation ATPase
MLSSNSVASRDSRDSFNDLNSSIRSNEGGELSRPKISPRSAKPPKSVGRRIINNLDSLTKPKEKGVETSTIKITDSTTMEELDHILEEDALKLINMKKDVFSAQQDELAKLKASVMNVKKEYDSLRALNSYKEKSLQALSDKKMNLSELDRSDSDNNTAGHHVLNTLRQQTSEILLQLTEEQRTSKMLTLMIKRLDDEIGQCRMEIAQLTVQSAQQTAQSAQLTAQSAQLTVQAAQLTAQSAQLTVQAAQLTAQSAQLTVQAAHLTAQLAQSAQLKGHLGKISL